MVAEPWPDVAGGFWFAPSVERALLHAREAGMRYEDLSGVYYPNRAEGWVTFYLEEADAFRSFDADGERACHT